MLNGTGRGFVTLSSHITNRYFIPNWGNAYIEQTANERPALRKIKGNPEAPLFAESANNFLYSSMVMDG